MDYDYTWLGFGLLIVSPIGSRLLEGEQAKRTHIELNMIESREALERQLEHISHTFAANTHGQPKQAEIGWSYF